MFQTVFQHCPVVQPGQRVVMRQELQSSLAGLARRFFVVQSLDKIIEAFHQLADLIHVDHRQRYQLALAIGHVPYCMCSIGERAQDARQRN
ncbi:hypothetical protein D3C85_1407710 [compost metagenome]